MSPWQMGLSLLHMVTNDAVFLGRAIVKIANVRWGHGTFVILLLLFGL